MKYFKNPVDARPGSSVASPGRSGSVGSRPYLPSSTARCTRRTKRCQAGDRRSCTVVRLATSRLVSGGVGGVAATHGLDQLPFLYARLSASKRHAKPSSKTHHGRAKCRSQVPPHIGCHLTSDWARSRAAEQWADGGRKTPQVQYGGSNF